MKLHGLIVSGVLFLAFGDAVKADLLAEINFAAEGTQTGPPPTTLPMHFTMDRPPGSTLPPITFTRDIGLADVGVPFEIDDLNLVFRFRSRLSIYSAGIHDQAASLGLVDLLSNGWSHGAVNFLAPGLFDRPIPSHITGSVTFTADRLSIQPLPGDGWSWSASQTVRVYGSQTPTIVFPNTDPNPIVVDDNLQFSSEPGSFHVSLSKNVSRTGDPFTEIEFLFDGSTIQEVGVLSLDAGADYYIVEPGQIFSERTVADGQFQPLHTIGADGGFVDHTPVTVGSGEFFIGIATSYSLHPTIPPDVYGWVHLKPVNGVLTMDGNVMSYNSRGIIVGTTTTVPEPATCAALGLGILLVTLTNHRNRASTGWGSRQTTKISTSAWPTL